MFRSPPGCSSSKGHEVIGVFMQTGKTTTNDEYRLTKRDRADAMAVRHHRHRHEVVNFAGKYRPGVSLIFWKNTAAGRTPNPDVLCNAEIKFGVSGLRRQPGRKPSPPATTPAGWTARAAPSLRTKAQTPTKTKAIFKLAATSTSCAWRCFRWANLHKPGRCAEIASQIKPPNARKKTAPASALSASGCSANSLVVLPAHPAR